MKEYEKIFFDDISKIGADSVHGASHLTVECVYAMKRLIAAGASQYAIRRGALQMAQVRPMMASIFRFANDLLFHIEGRHYKKEALFFCDRYLMQMKKSSDKSSFLAAKQIAQGDRVLTHSFSSLVYETLIRAAKYTKFRVICTESRPKNEGVRLARQLCRFGIETLLVSDAAAPAFCKEADLVLIGSDGIGRFGLVHKVGTFAILLGAQRYGVRSVCVTTQTKFWPGGVESVSEPLKDPGELADEDCYEIANIYFDITPLKYISKIVTEKEVLNNRQCTILCEKIPLHPLLQ